MLILKQPRIESNIECSRLVCPVVISEQEGVQREETLWYEVENEYASYLCRERLDGALVSVLSYAMHNKHDIICEMPISERLYYQLVNFYIPIISREMPEWNHKIEITAQTISERIENSNAVGTSVSGGVDSFYSIFENLNPIVKSVKLTHLLLLNAGGTGNSGDERPRIGFKEKLEFMKGYIEDVDLKFIKMDTNLNEFYNAGEEGCHYSGACRLMGCILNLQKLFSVYHFPSGVTLKSFRFSPDPHYYDLFNLYCFSTESLTVYSSGLQFERDEKVEKIVGYSPTFKYLNVCNYHFNFNCSKCEKCVRTIMELEATGMIGQYREVFDLNMYYKNRWKLIGRYIGDREHKEFFKAIAPKLKNVGKDIPLLSYVYFYLICNPYNIARKKLRNVTLVRKIYEALGGIKRFPRLY